RAPASAQPPAGGRGRLMAAPRMQMAEELLRSFSATMRSLQLYSKGHPIIMRNIGALSTAIQLLHAMEPEIVIGLVGNEIIVDDTPVSKAETLGSITKRLRDTGIERITIGRGVTGDELAEFAVAVASLDRVDDPAVALGAFVEFKHIRVGRVAIEHKVEADAGDMGTIRRMYAEAVSAANTIWDSAQTEGKPDATLAKSM